MRQVVTRWRTMAIACTVTLATLLTGLCSLSFGAALSGSRQFRSAPDNAATPKLTVQ